MPCRWLRPLCLAVVAIGVLPPGIRQPARAQTARRRLIARLTSPVDDRAAADTPLLARVLPVDVTREDPVAGCLLEGHVEPGSSGNHRRLRLRFEQVRDHDDVRVALPLRLVDVDNARETVDESGVVHGLDRIRVRPSKKEDLLLLLAHAHPFLLAATAGTRLALRAREHPGIHFPAGTDVWLDAAELPSLRCGTRPVADTPAGPALAELASTWPARAVAGGRPADWVNLAFLAPATSVEAAFAAAGWAPADRASLRADVKAFLATAEHEGYRTAPVSTLTLEGATPAYVFQKQTNTFAKRHHVRIWSTGTRWDGMPVWLAAATHDVGIKFSREAGEFAHRIDADIDGERGTILRDLAEAGALSHLAWLERAGVPAASVNASGDRVVTDGRLALVELAAPGR